MAKRFDDETDLAARAAPGSSPLWLAILGEAGLRTMELPSEGRLTIGRAPDCTIVIDDTKLSRCHAALSIGKDGVSVEDLGSRNGTAIGNRVLKSGEHARLQLGDAVLLGSSTLVLQSPRARKPPTANDKRDDAVVRSTSNLATPLLRRIASSGINVLILGETGVGKELTARAMHEQSPRAKKPLVSINCAALAETLLDSELFGHEKGAFTGAQGEKPGLIESADGGSLFLDEVGEMPQSVQAKLLRVIELKQVQRIGALRPRQIDVRFIAATHRDLDAAVREGRFREDLLFRLNGMSLVVAPLRERVAEIDPLAELFLREASERMRLPVIPTLSSEARALLHGYRWPGNVRELRNVLERAVVLGGGDVITPRELPLDKMRESLEKDKSTDTRSPITREFDRRAAANRSTTVEEEKQRILAALERAGGNQATAAQLLGFSRRTLVNRMAEFGLSRSRKR